MNYLTPALEMRGTILFCIGFVVFDPHRVLGTLVMLVGMLFWGRGRVEESRCRKRKIKHMLKGKPLAV